MHINYDEVEILIKEVKAKYGRDLVGRNMGQFHIDFERMELQMIYMP